MTTRDEILALTDDELRKRCLRVMGWHSTVDESTWSPTAGDPPYMYYEDTPDFAGAVEAAFMLIEEARKRGYWSSLEYRALSYPSKDVGWRARLRSVGWGSQRSYTTEHQQLARAIALAFLMMAEDTTTA